MTFFSFRSAKQVTEADLDAQFKKLSVKQQQIVNAFIKTQKHLLSKGISSPIARSQALTHALYMAVGGYDMKNCEFLYPWLLIDSTDKMTLEFSSHKNEDSTLVEKLDWMLLIVKEHLSLVKASDDYANKISHLSIDIPYALDKDSAAKLSMQFEALFKASPKGLHEVEIKFSGNNLQPLSESAIKAILNASHHMQVSLDNVVLTQDQLDAHAASGTNKKTTEKTAFARKTGLNHINCVKQRNSGTLEEVDGAPKTPVLVKTMALSS